MTPGAGAFIFSTRARRAYSACQVVRVVRVVRVKTQVQTWARDFLLGAFRSRVDGSFGGLSPPPLLLGAFGFALKLSRECVGSVGLLSG
jgi:hypothetical protein